MKILQEFWRYWTWVCVALMTSFVVLAVVAALVISFRADPLGKTKAQDCIDSGGTWDAEEGGCKRAA